MSDWRLPPAVRQNAHFVLALIPLLLAATLATGRLPVDPITTAQGLVSDRVTHITPSSHGFLWIGTQDGLSRYDGQAFVNYTQRDGLPHPFVTTVIESRDGAIYVATIRGLVRMDARATRERGVFTRIAFDGGINDIIEDRAGTLWVGCGISLCTVQGDRLVRDPSYPGPEARVLAPSRDGTLWVGSTDGLFRRSTNGSWERFAIQPHRGADQIEGLAIDEAGQLWISNGFGVFVSDVATLPRSGTLAERVTRTYRPGDRLQGPGFLRLTSPAHPIVVSRTAYRTRDGAMWIPSAIGVVRVRESEIELLGERAGVHGAVNVVSEDAAGNLWLGSEVRGALRVSPDGATTFTRDHGLQHERINQIFAWNGTVCATSGSTRYLQCFENGSLVSAELIPPSIEFTGWGWGHVVARDRAGAWWVATGQGVVHWPAVSSIRDFARTRPAIYDTRHGLGGDDVFRIFADSRGDLWFSTFGPSVLTRRSGGTFRAYTERDGMPKVAPLRSPKTGPGTCGSACTREDCCASMESASSDLAMRRGFRAGSCTIYSSTSVAPSGSQRMKAWPASTTPQRQPCGRLRFAKKVRFPSQSSTHRRWSSVAHAARCSTTGARRAG